MDQSDAKKQKNVFCINTKKHEWKVFGGTPCILKIRLNIIINILFNLLTISLNLLFLKHVFRIIKMKRNFI